MRYSVFNLVAQTLRGHRHWQPAWRDAAPKPLYDIVIVGGGGHGLATAYYLAKEHGLANIAVSRRAGSARAMPGATPPSSGPTTASRAISRSMNCR